MSGVPNGAGPSSTRAGIGNRSRAPTPAYGSPRRAGACREQQLGRRRAAPSGSTPSGTRKNVNSPWWSRTRPNATSRTRVLPWPTRQPGHLSLHDASARSLPSRRGPGAIRCGTREPVHLSRSAAAVRSALPRGPGGALPLAETWTARDGTCGGHGRATSAFVLLPGLELSSMRRRMPRPRARSPRAARA